MSEDQSTFVEGKSTLDNTLIATEIIHDIKRKVKWWHVD